MLVWLDVTKVERPKTLIVCLCLCLCLCLCMRQRLCNRLRPLGPDLVVVSLLHHRSLTQGEMLKTVLEDTRIEQSENVRIIKVHII